MTWVALGESVTGSSHRTRNIPCQDAFRFRTFGAVSEWLGIVIADGAGSALHSDVGATLACDELVRQIETLQSDVLLSRDGIIALFGGVRDTLLAEAQSRGVPPRELACTLLLAVVGLESATFAQLGDGGIVVGNGEDDRAVFWPEPVEYANATDFLTDDRFADYLRFEMTGDPIVEVAAFTDGLQRLALDFFTRTPHAGFFRPIFNKLRTTPEPESLAEPFRTFLDSERVNERTDDDKTLVLAVRRL